MRVAGALLFALAIPAAGAAQMTVTGQVTSSTGAPVQDATVSVPALSIAARTGSDGRYNFIIRAAQVMGQTVNMTARHGRFGAQTVQIRIVGGSLEQNFVLQSAQQPVPPRDTQPRPGQPPAQNPIIDPPATDFPRGFPIQRPAPGALYPPGVGGWPRDFVEYPGLIVGRGSGPADLVSSLAGQHASLHIAAASTPDGTSSMLYRGVRSFFNNTRPLMVVDGIPVDNQGFSTIAQRFGQGGFDFGSPLNDLPLAEVASVDMLDPVTATMRYGSRAANGVIDIRTRRAGEGLFGLSVTANTRYAASDATRLPQFQNSFGQGLGGQFEFFDGRGGGINDDIAQSWGPRLDARAIPQHSLTEPRRPDVRHFLPQPDDVDDYFEGASDIAANVAFLATGRNSGARLAIDVRNASGLTPGAELRQLSAGISGSSRAVKGLTAALSMRLTGTLADQRPGTGFDEINPVSGITRMGRQVDLDALRARVTDDDGEQINWIYTNRNNPFFATTRNHNESDRRHTFASLALNYDFASWLAATMVAGTDDWLETRKVRVAGGWLGGFPTTLGRGDFGGGGSDNQTVGASEQIVTLGLSARRESSLGWGLTGALGGEMRTNEFTTTAVVTDTTADGTASVVNLEREGSHDVTAFFASGGVTRASLTLDAGVRLEQSSPFSKSLSEVYPTARLTYDVARGMPEISRALNLGETKLVARWWRAGNEITRRSITSAFSDGTAVAPENAVSGAERTEGLELGVHVSSPARRFGFDVIGYRERSTDLLVAAIPGDGSVSLAQAGEIFNGGFYALVGGTLLENWRGLNGGFRLNVARNSGTVDAVHPDASQVQLSPDLFGAQLAARVGGESGVIVGSRYLRTADGSLVLRDGLPIADANDRFSVLGSVHPDWSASLDTRWMYRGVILHLTVDTRMGGRIFSATNMWGSFAGTLESTLIGDRAANAATGDSLTIAGIDSVSGAANTIKVSAEQYFHALGGITEPWVYDAGFTKLRELGLSYMIPTRFVPGFREHTLRVSLIGRNLMTWTRAPNIDPSVVAGGVTGFEMGQLPGARSFGIQLAIQP